MAVEASGSKESAAAFRGKGWRCYLCGCADAERVARNVDFGLDIYTCLGCGLTQTDYVDEDDLDEYYQSIYSAAQGRATSETYSDFSLRRGKAQRRFIETVTGRSEFPSVLDFGAGAGGGVAAFSEDSKKVVAWDPDPLMRGVLEKLDGIEVIANDVLTSGEFDGAFDLIILSHVFEHLSDPRVTLAKLAALLKEGGVLFIEVPYESPQVVRDIALHLKTGTGHVFHFNRVTLKRMVEADGLFKSEAVTQCGSPASDFLDKGEALDPDAGDNPDGIWLRGVFIKQKSAPVSSRDLDDDAGRRRFSALVNMSLESASLRSVLRKVYGSFLNVIERPSAYPGVREAIDDEGAASAPLKGLVEEALQSFNRTRQENVRLRERVAKFEAAAKSYQLANERLSKDLRQQFNAEKRGLVEDHANMLSTQQSKQNALKRKVFQLEERLRRTVKERDLYRNSTSYRIGRFLLSPISLLRSKPSQEPVEVEGPASPPPNAPNKTADIPDILVVCHDTSMSTGAPRPARGYFDEMKSRGAPMRLLALPRWDNTETAEKPLPPANKVIINSIASLRWRAVRNHLETGSDNTWVYLHETGWAMEKFREVCPEGFATLKKIAPTAMFLAVSDAQKEFFENEYGARNVTVIRNVTQNANLDPANVRTLTLEDPEPLVIMVGTIQARKGVELFSQVADLASQKGKPWRFRWIGHATGDTLYQSENVDWAGVLKGDALAGAYKEASLFFLSSIDDPFPLASLEAMSYGVNVVCYRDVGTAEVIGELTGSMVFSDYDPGTAFNAIEAALCAESDGEKIFETVKPLVDPVHFADVVNRAIGYSQ
ncbi:methyltransferase domain-containing protein [Hyphococcus flavus]|uniref:Methyltransferase domain-containing protein n=1 Tax=Hyphococcus flavus TaxID=1866326 RepID=A0AAE9ZCS5_9PROT|nr:methyltransferase domain-containing protein [Hyphococcus flavus]WDI32484.1 methyltransferase domain-containing protein [Hyphococcus flavus]